MRKKRGLDDWFGAEKWVDISAPKEGGGFKDCGRDSAKDSSRGYPKCVPSAKASSMSKKQIASAVSRKRAKKQGVGGKPTNVKTLKSGGEVMKMKSKGGMKGGMMKSKGMAKGGAMKTKGYANGGVARTKGSVKGGAKKPSSKNSGLYGRR